MLNSVRRGWESKSFKSKYTQAHRVCIVSATYLDVVWVLRIAFAAIKKKRKKIENCVQGKKEQVPNLEKQQSMAVVLRRNLRTEMDTDTGTEQRLKERKTGTMARQRDDTNHKFSTNILPTTKAANTDTTRHTKTSTNICTSSPW
jgi:hypothetical protein